MTRRECTLVARAHGIPKSVVSTRLGSGWDREQAATKPVRIHGSYPHGASRQILALVRERPDITRAQITSTLDLKQGTIDSAMKRMRRRGEIP